MTEADLLAAIDADPDSDAPRLAHADWLEANGDPDRAEYIRLQLAHAARAHLPHDYELPSRAQTLLVPHRERWLGRRPRHPNLDWQFVRGYPEEAVFTFLTAFASACRRGLLPPLRWVEFHEIRSLAKLAEPRGLARIGWQAGAP